MASAALPLPIVLPGNSSAVSPQRHDSHRHSRFFIGPMPEKVVSRKKAARKTGKQQGFRAFYPSTVTLTNDHDLSHHLKAHALNFFINGGGRVEDWDDTEEQNTIETMAQRWKESDWGKIVLSSKGDNQPSSRWVGGSFEIGSFLGMNIIHNGTFESNRDGVSISRSSRKAKSSTEPEANEETLPVIVEPVATLPGPQPSSLLPNDLRAAISPPAENNDTESQIPVSASSSTALLKPFPLLVSKANALKPILRAKSSPAVPSGTGVGDAATSSPPKVKSSARLVHYAKIPNGAGPGPAPPEEVLQRRGSAVQGTSAGSTIPDCRGEDIRWGDVVMRDRMLVRVMHTKLESIGYCFDENQNRTMEKLNYEDWAEHLVVWRRDRIEIYQNYTLPWKEWLLGHKDLAFIVPLKTSRTHLSLYSFVDLTFCITCPPISADTPQRFITNRSGEGTNIFVFKAKSRTRALDWFWKLWRHIGGQIPRTLDIRNPDLDVRVAIELPQPDLREPDQTLSRQDVIALCSESLKSVPNWDYVIQRRLAEGNSLELAWRSGTNIDWIWQDECVDGLGRDWAVLCGLALHQKSCSPHLELRIGEHFPRTVHTKDGTKLHEPPGIEGYLDRIKPNSQVKQPVYLCTHDGNIFYLIPWSAYPPSPPGLNTSAENSFEDAPTMRQEEAKRGSQQILNAMGVNDFRDILVVRRAFQHVPQPSHKEAMPKNDDAFEELWTQSQPEISGSDDEDEGGDEGMARSNDKITLKTKRSFELLLKTGHIIRFEAYSRRVALEWIDRLRALVVYWRQRHNVDAREEMDVVQGTRSRLTPLISAHHGKHEPTYEAPDLSASLPTLSSIYHWCAMKGCKPIVRSGKLHARRGLYGPYRMVHLFLVSGQLVQYHISPKYSIHRRQPKIVNLLDAYVCSGYFAARVLPQGQYDPNAPRSPRRYYDGLETDDLEEDTLFTILYRKKAPVVDTSSGTKAVDTVASQNRVHRLGATRKLVIFRTRSKFERDTWCWALNCEIEKLVRMTRDREAGLRAQGGLLGL